MTEQLLKIKKKVKRYLDKERYDHTIGVMHTCACLAMRYGADMDAALTAGLLHDCAKGLSSEEKLRLCKKYHLEVSEAERANPGLLHAKLGAFFAWQNLAQLLDHNYGFVTPSYLTDPANWSTAVLEDFFLGSQGKRVGSLYAGADDITLYTPLFDTNLTYACPAYGFTRTGPFNQSVCFPERVEEQDWFNGNPYTYYAGGDYPLATITNHNNPDGPRIVMLRDSFACALAPFLSLSCSELITIDLRHFDGDLMETIGAYDPDLVLTLYTASTTGLENMFQFDKTEG